MKRLSVILALLAFLIPDLTFAAGALVTSVTGLAQVQSSGNPARVLRQGDEVNQGETVTTGANSSVVLKFDDGQIAALTSNSRMIVSSYRYDPAAESGNVLLSLLTGGMRTITGLIGRRNPNNVAYRAATATIGIRGTDNTTVTDGTNVLETVLDGVVVFQDGDLVVVITRDEAFYFQPGKPPIKGGIGQVLAALPPAFAAAIQQSGALSGAILAASPGTPRQGQNDQGQQQGQQGNGSGQQGGQQGGGSGGGGGGGGRASGS